MMSDPQYYLDKLAASDQFGFLKKADSNYETHRSLLYLSLSLTDLPLHRNDVVEFGSGMGSTPYLRKYCSANSRHFNSYDNNKEWADKTGSQYVEHWDAANVWQPCGLLFIDHSPGEHRRAALIKMADKAEIIVVHDTELIGGGDYKLEPCWPLFKYVLHYNRTGGGAGATAVSNTIDLNKFKGLKLGEYQFE